MKTNTRMVYSMQIAAIALIYFVAAKLGLSLAFTAEQVSAVWPPTGFALAVIIFMGYRVWPGIALGAFLANITAHEPFITAFGITTGNTLEAVTGAWLIHRFGGFEPSLSRLRDVLKLIFFAAMLSTALSATIGVTSLCAGGLQPWSAFDDLWRVWWLGDGIGDLVIAPLLMTFWTQRGEKLNRRRTGELCAYFIVLLVIGDVVSIYAPDKTSYNPLKYIIFPLIIWAALRFGPAIASLSTLIISLLAIRGMLQGLGPFSLGSNEQNIIFLQLYMGTVAVIGLVLAATNAERRRTEQMLREREAQIRDTLKAANVGTWNWDMRTGNVQWSENMEQIHQLPAGAFAGKFEDFVRDIHPQDRERVHQTINRAIEQNGLYDVEYRQLRPGNAIGWLEAKGQAFYDDEHKPIRMAGICMEVTERKQLELRLKKATDDLAQQVRERTLLAEQQADQLQEMAIQLTQVENRERRRLAATLHDGLQQLLIGAQYRVSLVRNRAATDPESIGETTRQLDDILKQCVQASRSLAYDLSPPGLIDRGFCGAIEWLASQMLEKHGLHVEVTAEEEPAGLTHDIKAFLFQTVRELLFNIVKHAGVAKATVRIISDERTVKVEVADGGKGFDVATLSGEPHGLGLVSIRERISLLGGRLDIESQPGEGSRFIVTMRIGEKSRDAKSALEATPPARLFPILQKDRPRRAARAIGVIKILIVDDHPMMRSGLAALLGETPGIKIIGLAASGIEAIELTRKNQPDVIVMDVTMPGMDGIEATRCIHEEFPEIKIIALSMHEDEGIAARMQASGAAIYLNKSDSSDLLLSAIRGESKI